MLVDTQMLVNSWGSIPKNDEKRLKTEKINPQKDKIEVLPQGVEQHSGVDQL